ncbi:MAG: 50S ribosomal protein L16 [Candidatus Omnitrophota bacterium]|nr:MAG: 50S ribosomal protein L16 [Candidatus Omnitrophota bacterium]
MIPISVKFRNSQRGISIGLAVDGCDVNFGEYGLQALENAWLKNTQIEAARVVLTHHLRGGGKVWIRIFPDKSVSKKPAETRMGKGKGMPEFWVAVIRRGRVLFEVEGVPGEVAKDALRLAASKIPFKTKLIGRKHV